jgi:hypothetical protein
MKYMDRTDRGKWRAMEFLVQMVGMAVAVAAGLPFGAAVMIVAHR